jgi:hypothetical protein
MALLSIYLTGVPVVFVGLLLTNTINRWRRRHDPSLQGVWWLPPKKFATLAALTAVSAILWPISLTYTVCAAIREKIRFKKYQVSVGPNGVRLKE